jgi:hypothetical protein
MHAMEQAKESQGKQGATFRQHGRSPSLQRHGDSHTEEGQPVDKENENEIEAQTSKRQLKISLKISTSRTEHYSPSRPTISSRIK